MTHGVYCHWYSFLNKYIRDANKQNQKKTTAAYLISVRGSELYGTFACDMQLLPLYVMDRMYYPGFPGLFTACIFSGALR